LSVPSRRWELTNTRYLLGPAAFLDFLNQNFDPGSNRFRIATRFDLAIRPDADSSVPQAEQITTIISTNGQLAVFDFTGSLPRAKLYTHWKVSTNEPAKLRAWVKEIQPRVPKDWGAALESQTDADLATLYELADKSFDPQSTVLLTDGLPVAPGTNANPGEVSIVSYAPREVVLAAKASAPCVLLLNDKFDPNWKVTVDGQTAKLLRCNFIVCGVFLEQPGEHRVEFRFQPSPTGQYVSGVTAILAVLLWGCLAFVPGRQGKGAKSEPTKE